MKKYLRLLPCLFLFGISITGKTQTLTWSSFTDSIPTLSSPRVADLTGDGIKDIVIGGGTDSTDSNHGIMAFNGANGNLLWNIPTKNEIFASAKFQDITGDGIPDVFVSGREAQLYAINGSNGNIIWDFFPYLTNPADSGLYNFYSPQFVPDMNSDLIPDILVTNGGDHSAPVWDTTRPPGHLMVIDAMTGALLAKAVVPDSAETYCSPIVADVRNNGILWVIFGTGGETLGGSMWAAELVNDLMTNDLSNAIPLATHPTRGFIAPASVGDFTGTGELDIIIQGYDGTVYRVKGSDFTTSWSTNIPGTESSAAPVLGNFTGNITPDVFCVLAKGVAPSYTDFYQVMLEGENGTVSFKDSVGALHFASANAFDTNGDGRDEVLITLNEFIGYFVHQLKLIDFQNDTIIDFWNQETGCNVGSTPWIGDLDNNLLLDVIYVVKRDSMNPMGWKGIYLRRLETNFDIPVAGVAWGSYMGTGADGHYTYLPVDCGAGSIISGASSSNPTCNGYSDGFLDPLTANGTPPFTYLWNDGSVDSVRTNLPAGFYEVRITDANGCWQEGSITLTDPFFISFGGVQNVLCEGGSNGQATVSSSGCVCMFSGCTYLWDAGSTTYTATGLTAGEHSVAVTHANGCVVYDTVYINDGLPLVDTTNLVNVSCYGWNDGEISVTALNPGNTFYNWSNGESTNVIDSLLPGTYEVYISDVRPCYDTLTFVVAQPDSLELQTVSTDVSPCNGDDNGTVNLTASGGNGDYIFYLDATNSSTGLFSYLPAGNYQVYVTDSLGCNSDTTAITITEPLVITTSTSSVMESGTGNNGSATVVIGGGVSPYAVTWNDPTSQTTLTATGLTEGWYTVTITDSIGCTTTDSVEVLSSVFIAENGDEIHILVYPNPATDQIIVSLNRTPAEALKISLHDIQGRLVQPEMFVKQNSIIIQRGSLAGGNYILTISDNRNVMNVKVNFR